MNQHEEIPERWKRQKYRKNSLASTGTPARKRHSQTTAHRPRTRCGSRLRTGIAGTDYGMYSICTRSICPSKSNGARSEYASETDEPRSQPTSNDSVAVNVSGTVNGVVASSACLPSMLKISLAGAPGLAADGNV